MCKHSGQTVGDNDKMADGQVQCPCGRNLWPRPSQPNRLPRHKAVTR